MGETHLANLVHRKGINGDKFVGWGSTPITEWTVGSELEGIRVHKAVAADVDGDIDITSKPWHGDLHFYAENKLNRLKMMPGSHLGS